MPISNTEEATKAELLAKGDQTSKKEQTKEDEVKKAETTRKNVRRRRPNKLLPTTATVTMTTNKEQRTTTNNQQMFTTMTPNNRESRCKYTSKHNRSVAKIGTIMETKIGPGQWNILFNISLLVFSLLCNNRSNG